MVRRKLLVCLALVCAVVAALFGFMAKRTPTPGDVRPSVDPLAAAQGADVRMEVTPSSNSSRPSDSNTAPRESSRPVESETARDGRHTASGSGITPTKSKPRVVVPDPAKPCRLQFQVVDAGHRPVTSLQGVSVERSDGVHDDPPGDAFPFISTDGSFVCNISDMSGTIRVHSAALGNSSAEFPRPSGGTSSASLVLANFATIHGRVVRDGQAIEGASVQLLPVYRNRVDPEVKIVEGWNPDTCRGHLDEVTSGKNGEYQFAVQETGQYALVARSSPLGACTSDPFVITSARESKELDLALRPASRVELRGTLGKPPVNLDRLSLWGDNGIREEVRLEKRDYVVSFDSLPSGTYWALRPCQYPGPETDDPPRYIDVDGAPETQIRQEMKSKGSIQLSVALGKKTGSRLRARLFRQDCSYTLVSERVSNADEVTLAAGNLGSHLLALEWTSHTLAPSHTRIMRVTLAEGPNPLLLAPIEFAGEIACTTDKFDLVPNQTFARYRMSDGSELFVQFRPGTEVRRKRTAKDRFFCSCKAPVGTCDIVRAESGAFVTLFRDVHVSAGAPTEVRH